MKNKWFLGILFIFIIVVGMLLVLQNKKTKTSIVIASVSPKSPQVGEKIRFNCQLVSNATDFTIIALSDTQYYSAEFPEIYFSQTQWIVDNKNALNIVFVTHLGDLVQNNDLNIEEWVVADAAMSLLDDVVPYGVLAGNHDMQPDGRAEYYEEYFPSSRYEDQSWWGGSFSQNKNNYQLFSAGGDEYVILHIQYCPPIEVVDWANGILQEYSDRKAIISTHAFLMRDASRLGNCNHHSDGDIVPAAMWGKLIKNNINNFLVLAGHIPGAARRVDHQGRFVYQLLSDYQGMENGGNGYLRIMNFQPSKDIIRITTYSPYLGEYLSDDDNQFDLSFDMTSGSLPTGEIIVSNGMDECVGTIEEGSCELVLTTVGENNFTATYSGDADHKSSSSSEILVFVENE